VWPKYTISCRGWTGLVTTTTTTTHSNNRFTGIAKNIDAVINIVVRAEHQGLAIK
jgi:hypothetical protein